MRVQNNFHTKFGAQDVGESLSAIQSRVEMVWRKLVRNECAQTLVGESPCRLWTLRFLIAQIISRQTCVTIMLVWLEGDRGEGDEQFDIFQFHKSMSDWDPTASNSPRQ